MLYTHILNHKSCSAAPGLQILTSVTRRARDACSISSFLKSSSSTTTLFPTAIASQKSLHDTCQQPGGYGVHPAVLDAATHTAAAFASAESSEDAHFTRIPAALDAFCAASATVTSHAIVWCTGTLERLLSSGTVVTSFHLASETSVPAASISGFQAKMIRSHPDATVDVLPALQYSITWQSQEPVKVPFSSIAHHSHAMQPGSVHWVVSPADGSPGQVYRMPSQDVRAPARGAAHSVELLQQMVSKSEAGTSLQLITRGSLSFPSATESPGAVSFAFTSRCKKPLLF